MAVALLAVVLFSTVLANTFPGRVLTLGWNAVGAVTGVHSVAEDGHPSLYRAGKAITVFHDAAPLDRRVRCTASFVVQRLGRSYGLTSKHCGGVGSQVWLGRYGGEATKLGRVVDASKVDDVAMFEVGATDGQVWADDAPTRVGGLVPRRDLRPGMALYQHGSTTGREVRGEAAGVDPEGLWCMTVADGDQAHGDSGGPVYAYADDGSVLAVGIIKAHGADDAGAAYACFVPIDTALRALSASLVVRDAAGVETLVGG